MDSAVHLTPDAGPNWLRPLVANLDGLRETYLRRFPADVRAMVQEANASASSAADTRDAAVLVLFSSPPDDTADGRPPATADLLLTVRAPTMRHHAGQVAFPGGAADPGDTGPVSTALREAHEETGLDPSRLHLLAIMDRIFIPPSRFHVAPVLAYSSDPGPVAAINGAETATVARVPLRAFVNPENRLMVCRDTSGRRWSGPAFLLNEMLVWGFTAQVISGMLDVAGWAQPWNTDRVRELDDAEAAIGNVADLRDARR